MTNDILLDKILNYTERLLLIKEENISKQNEFIFEGLLRASTTMGATFSDLMYPLNKADFVLKLQIALKKAAETEYWLKLYKKAAKLEGEEITALLSESVEFKKIFMASIAASKSGKPQESKVIVKADTEETFRS